MPNIFFNHLYLYVICIPSIFIFNDNELPVSPKRFPMHAICGLICTNHTKLTTKSTKHSNFFAVQKQKQKKKMFTNTMEPITIKKNTRYNKPVPSCIRLFTVQCTIFKRKSDETKDNKQRRQRRFEKKSSFGENAHIIYSYVDIE